MKKPFPESLNKYRVKEGFFGSLDEYEFNGLFIIPYKADHFRIIVSDQMGWDHVSVSLGESERCPTWEEMCFIKDLFFDPEEAVVQYHPPKKDYVNVCNKCLHLWKPQGVSLILPPKNMVG